MLQPIMLTTVFTIYNNTNMYTYQLILIFYPFITIITTIMILIHQINLHCFQIFSYVYLSLDLTMLIVIDNNYFIFLQLILFE